MHKDLAKELSVVQVDQSQTKELDLMNTLVLINANKLAVLSVTTLSSKPPASVFSILELAKL